MIVEFLEGRDFLTAWVLAPSARRLGVLAADGREMSIAIGRVLNSIELPDPGSRPARLELLRATEATRRNMAASLDLTELWSVLEGEGDEFGFENLAALIFGRSAQADEVSAVARAVFADSLRFRFTPGGALRQNQAEVERLSEARNRAEAAERALAVCAEWLAALKQGSPAPEPPEAGAAKTRLLSLALEGHQAPAPAEAKKLLARAGFAPEPEGAIEALTLAGEFRPHENLDLRRLELPIVFSPALLEETRRTLSGAASPASGRRESRLDLTGLPTMTIDSNGARDLDDAISIKSLAGGRWQVGLHITDVAAVIPPDSPLDLAGRERGISVYLPEAKYPMLPPELSEGWLSLAPGEVRPALSFLVTLEKDGAVADYELNLSHVRVDRQLSFTEADALLEEEAELVDLWDLAQTLLARRLAGGGVNLNLPRLSIHLLPDGSLNLGLTQWDTPAKIIVGELMILANHLAADLLHRKGYPCPFRFQEKSREPVPAELSSAVPGRAADDRLLAASLAARRRLGRGGISFTPAPHLGLGLGLYTAFTAPMRRYLDLLVARQLRALVLGRPPVLDQGAFIRLALPVNDYAQRLRKMQGGRLRYWLKQHLKDKTGREYSALVYEQRDRRLRVCLTDYMLETELLWPRKAGGPPEDMVGRRLQARLVEVPPGEAPPRYEIVL